ncbi:hypothetical protein GGR56DRAFT_146440 [Xylariaceae sp. FL0804]|nr:hypothetical protein GGR56DRAFT_146440 [Xylariaceae sp. FL0804]
MTEAAEVLAALRYASICLVGLAAVLFFMQRFEVSAPAHGRAHSGPATVLIPDAPDTRPGGAPPGAADARGRDSYRDGIAELELIIGLVARQPVSCDFACCWTPCRVRLHCATSSDLLQRLADSLDATTPFLLVSGLHTVTDACNLSAQHFNALNPYRSLHVPAVRLLGSLTAMTGMMIMWW